MDIWARLSTWNTPMRIGPAQHVVDRRVLGRHGRQRRASCRSAARAGRSALRMQVSMPSASTSTLRMPSASRSSLSHSMTVRSSIAAFSIGTSSSSRLRVRTKPPTCCERWRGKPLSSPASSSASREPRLGGIEAGSRDVLGVDAAIAPAPDAGGQRADRVVRQAQRLADLADRAARAVVDHGRGDAGALAAVFRVDVLDDLLAPLVLEVDVDVGRLVALGRDEALEQQVERGRDRPR